jgi:hypothetical protein
MVIFPGASASAMSFFTPQQLEMPETDSQKLKVGSASRRARRRRTFGLTIHLDDKGFCHIEWIMTL